MITVKQLIAALEALEEQGFGDLPCVFATDAEGNNYHKVENYPSEFIVEDINQYYLEAIDLDDDDIDLEDDNDEDLEDDYKNLLPNCVIIN